ncbi:MAG: hypothetical protein MZW92_04040 [Comamonadaceae bacterium]|nr:hypothetical protein [Comamonadaceae bacterium]
MHDRAACGWPAMLLDEKKYDEALQAAVRRRAAGAPTVAVPTGAVTCCWRMGKAGRGARCLSGGAGEGRCAQHPLRADHPAEARCAAGGGTWRREPSLPAERAWRRRGAARADGLALPRGWPVSSCRRWMPPGCGQRRARAAEPAPLAEFQPALTSRTAWRVTVGSGARRVSAAGRARERHLRGRAPAARWFAVDPASGERGLAHRRRRRGSSAGVGSRRLRGRGRHAARRGHHPRRRRQGPLAGAG